MNIKKATLDDLDHAARLFDLYRQFYEQPADFDKAKGFLNRRLSNSESHVYLAFEGDEALGFMQIYPTFCSVEAAPLLVLYDLYVAKDARGKGIGRKLLHTANELAAELGAVRVELSTGVQNIVAQGLYEDFGYVRDNQFYHYAYSL